MHMLELSGLICKACNRSTQCEEKMRTVAPEFWHCDSTEGRRQSQHDNSTVELDIFGTTVPGFTILKHFIPLHITFFLLYKKEMNSNKQYLTLTLNTSDCIKYRVRLTCNVITQWPKFPKVQLFWKTRVLQSSFLSTNTYLRRSCKH